MKSASSSICAALALVCLVTLPTAHADDTITLKMANQWPDDPNDYVVSAGKQFAQEVEKRSGGTIQIRIFPAESLVKALDTHSALRSGSIDLSVYPYIYSAGAIPEMNLVLLPGLWKTPKDVFEFRKSEAWQEVEAKAEAFGFKTLSWIQISGGVASKSKAIVVPADIAGQKVRAAGKMMEAALQKAGASTVSMSSTESYSAMQLGLLDGVWTSSGTFGSYRLFEVSKFYDSPEDYSVYFTIEPIAISMKTWKKLTPAQQKILMDVGQGMEQKSFEASVADDKRVAQLFAKAGAQVHRMTLPEWTQWQTLFRDVSWTKFRAEVPGGAALIDKSSVAAK